MAALWFFCAKAMNGGGDQVGGYDGQDGSLSVVTPSFYRYLRVANKSSEVMLG